MPMVFGDFDVSHFWDNSDYAKREYVGEPLSEELVASIEKGLGYRVYQGLWYTVCSKTKGANCNATLCKRTR